MIRKFFCLLAATQSSIVLSSNTVSKDKMVQILQKSTSEEMSGKLEFTPSMKPAE